MKNKFLKTVSAISALLITVSSALPVFAGNSSIPEEDSSYEQYEKGDVNSDGRVTALDARLVLRASAMLDFLNDAQRFLADYDDDGRVTAADARYILRYSAMLDPFAPETTTRPPETQTKPPETTTKKPEPATQSKPVSEADRKFTIESSDLFSASYAKYACVYDWDNDKVLYGKNMNSKCYPASTTKIITAVLGCEYLSPDYVLTVGNEQLLLAADTSRAGLKIGQKIKFKEILKCLLAPSGCDAAYTIGAHVARVASGDPNMSASKAINYYVNLMNTYAKKLGMSNSHFANPDGYPNSNHYTTALDMTKIAVKAYSFQLIRDVVCKTYVTARFESGKTVTYKNTNDTINSESGNYYPYMVGMKTGSHSKAGQCLVTVAEKKIEKTGKTKTFVIVVFNCPSKYARATDLKNLYNTAFSYFYRQP